MIKTISDSKKFQPKKKQKNRTNKQKNDLIKNAKKKSKTKKKKNDLIKNAKKKQTNKKMI